MRDRAPDQCPACGGRGWIARAESVLRPGEHPEYPEGLRETWWEPCGRCNRDAGRMPDPPEDEPWPEEPEGQ
jgi:hypothetical protein